VNKDSLILW